MIKTDYAYVDNMLQGVFYTYIDNMLQGVFYTYIDRRGTLVFVRVAIA